MRSDTSPITPASRALGYGAAWRELPKVIATYFGITVVGIGGYVAFQYAMGTFHTSPPVAARHPDPAAAVPPTPSSSSATPVDPVSVDPAPTTEHPPVPTASVTSPPVTETDRPVVNLADVIKSARRRNENVGQVVRQDGSRIIIQLLPPSAAGAVAQPKPDEYVTVGPLETRHDQGLTPGDDGSVRHVLLVSTRIAGQGSARSLTDSVAISRKHLDRLVNALKGIDSDDYEISLQVTSPAVKREVEAKLNE